MFKLLTEKDKDQLKREYSLRRVVVMLAALSLVLLVAVVSLFPSYLLSVVKRDELIERTQVAESIGAGSEDEDVRAWLANTNRKLTLLSPKLDTDRPSEIIEEILAERNAGISITKLTWKKTVEELVISVSGSARDRQALIRFEDRINASGLFSDVTLPVSNLAKDRDIDFSLKLSPKKPQ